MSDDLKQKLHDLSISAWSTTPLIAKDRIEELEVKLDAANDGWKESLDLTRLARQQYGDAKYQLAEAHAAGKAEGLRLAVDCIGHITQSEDRDAILALIPADTPAAKVTVQEAAKVLLAEWDEHGEWLQGELACYSLDTYGDLSPDIDGDWVNFSAVTAALRAIAGGLDE